MSTFPKQAEKFRIAHGLAFDFRDDGIFVLTAINAWKIVAEPDGAYALFHQNGHERPRGHGVLP